jgi:hypothetical protein
MVGGWAVESMVNLGLAVAASLEMVLASPFDCPSVGPSFRVWGGDLSLSPETICDLPVWDCVAFFSAACDSFTISTAACSG